MVFVLTRLWLFLLVRTFVVIQLSRCYVNG